jgi:LPXTG-motif cell wall-anchored protein
MNRTRLTLSALALALASSLAFAQNADPNTAGPTKNDYRLRVVEPAEGATITGGTVRVVVNTTVRQQVGDQEKKDDNTMPRPLVDIFIDDKLQGTLKEENNVLSVDAVTPGAHKLVVLAKNMSGEVIDRKEIKFNTVLAVADTSTTTRSTTVEETRIQSAPPPPAPAPVAPPPAPRPQTYSPPPAPAPAPVTIAETRQTELPATGTSDLALGAAGLALLVGGFALRRRA